MIVTIGAEKGGTGKSTLAVNLSVYLAHAGTPFALLDTDKQRTSSKWATRRDKLREKSPDIPKVYCPEKRGEGVYQMAKDLESQFGNVILDAGGRDSLELRYALTVCDLAIMPLAPSQFDLETLEEMIPLLNSSKALNQKLRVLFILNQIDMARDRASYFEAKETLDNLGIPWISLSKNTMKTLVAYRKSTVEGLGVIEVKNSNARAEIQLIGQEVFK